MKVLQVIQFFSPKMGGSVNNVYNLSRQLLTLGHEVTVCTVDSEFDDDFARSVKGLKTVVFPGCAGRFRYSPKMKDWLRQNIPEFDIVHLNNYWSYQNLVAARVARDHAVPYIISPRGSLPIQLRAYIIKYLFDFVFGRPLLKHAAKVVATTAMEKDQIISRGISGDFIRIIPNAVCMPPEEIKNGDQFRKTYKIPIAEKMILFLGRIHKIKGIDLLINAFADILPENKGTKLVIAGPDSGYLEEIKKSVKHRNISDSVIFVGPLYGKDKFAAYMAADIYVLPSRYEIFGNTLLEACACGTPVITTDRCGLAPVIDKKAGLVVEYDKGQLSRAILDVLCSPEKAKAFGEYGKKLVRNKYNWQKVAKDYLQLYGDVINN